MVQITKDEKETTLEIMGLHKLWAFKSQLKIPNEHILNAYQNEAELSNWQRIRMPGTSIPFLIHAGTFYEINSTIFMDIVNKKNAIIVELKDEFYNKLMIEVENPEAAIALLKE